MGATASVRTGKIETPDGYDKNKFKLIRVMFDKLDHTGDMVVAKEQLKCLSDYYIRNRLGRLQKNLNVAANTLNGNIKKLESQKDIVIDKLIKERDDKIRELRKEYRDKIQEITGDYTKHINSQNEEVQRTCDNLSQEMRTLQNVTDTGKDQQILFAITKGEKVDITFEKFFDFIKEYQLDSEIYSLQEMTQLAVQQELEQMKHLLG